MAMILVVELLLYYRKDRIKIYTLNLRTLLASCI